MKTIFFKCELCGDTVIATENNLFSCCNKEMERIIPNTTDAATEKHIPVVNIENNIANIIVGETIHPMTVEHYITFIYVITNKREIKYNLEPNMEPIVNLALETNETIKEVYAYCNLHSLWLNELK